MSQFNQQPQPNIPPSGNQPPTSGLPPASNQPPQPGFPPAGNQPPQPGFPPAGNQPPTRDLPLGGFQSVWNLMRSSNTVQGPRPFGITITAIVVAIIGCLNLLLVQMGLCGVSFISSLPLSSSPFAPPTTSIVAAVSLDNLILFVLYYSALGIAHLYMARGLWTLRKNAYWGIVGIEGFTIVIQLFVLIASHNGGNFFANIYIPVIIAGFLLVVEENRRVFQVPF
ncbi:MAG: hypothetical protein J2P36_10920 [Ktedonobacteraceae bacterium]|nr:hypothetical protein [Ktedonobacteraceae bacterium]